ncbi:MAG TPA: hypothetical protein PKW21_00610 [Rhabdaerophilum sp.]|nr:hypothetical protein [Rhabdaerophilum sp.]
MADYYPLLSRAVAGLADQPAEAREPIYARARDALERQLRGFEPPLAEESIRAELDDLAAAIRRIEDAFAPKPAEPEPPEPVPVSEEEPSAPPGVAPEQSEPEPDGIQPMVRPRIPEKVDNSGRKKVLALFSGIALVAMLTMGLVALSRRDTAPAPSGPPVVKAPEVSGNDPSKTEGRLSGTPEPTGKPPEPSAPPATPPSSPPSPPAQAEPPRSAPTATTNRAFMVLEAQGSSPNQFEGRVNWTFAPDPALKGEKALRAVIFFETAGLTIDFSVARNKDAKLDASHTIMVIFEPKNGIGNVREMSAVEWRERESQNGVTLAGVVVPVQDNVFMLGLDKSEAALTRNMALLQTQKWMVFELRLDNGRRGAILVEKGVAGEKAVNDAIAAWK